MNRTESCSPVDLKLKSCASAYWDKISNIHTRCVDNAIHFDGYSIRFSRGEIRYKDGPFLLRVYSGGVEITSGGRLLSLSEANGYQGDMGLKNDMEVMMNTVCNSYYDGPGENGADALADLG